MMPPCLAIRTDYPLELAQLGRADGAGSAGALLAGQHVAAVLAAAAEYEAAPS